jgi:hypothetical protein
MNEQEPNLMVYCYGRLGRRWASVWWSARGCKPARTPARRFAVENINRDTRRFAGKRQRRWVIELKIRACPPHAAAGG